MPEQKYPKSWEKLFKEKHVVTITPEDVWNVLSEAEYSNKQIKNFLTEQWDQVAVDIEDTAWGELDSEFNRVVMDLFDDQDYEE